MNVLLLKALVYYYYMISVCVKLMEEIQQKYPDSSWKHTSFKLTEKRIIVTKSTSVCLLFGQNELLINDYQLYY